MADDLSSVDTTNQYEDLRRYLNTLSYLHITRIGERINKELTVKIRQPRQELINSVTTLYNAINKSYWIDKKTHALFEKLMPAVDNLTFKQLEEFNRVRYRYRKNNPTEKQEYKFRGSKPYQREERQQREDIRSIY